MTNLVSVRGLKKRFENHEALKGIDLDIPRGTIFGLLGPNGAGKTTLIRNLTQIYLPDSGSITFDGEALDPKHIGRIGYMPEERGLYKKMKIGEQLIYLARLRGLSAALAKEKVNQWLKHFDIEDWFNKKVEDLSKGMQQKVQFISTILHEPDLLILDEPFSGLDPINANLIKDEILALKERGTTIIFSTHRMESVEEMCEEIALINNGEIILQGEVGAVRQQYKQNLFEVVLAEGFEWPGVLNDQFPATSKGQRVYHVYLAPAKKPSDLLKALVNAGTEVVALQEILPTVNEIFIQQVKSYSYE
jgi:ABC-2 type transport system ATP-binding protein